MTAANARSVTHEDTFTVSPTDPAPTATQVPAETTAPLAPEDAPTDAPADGPGLPWWLLLLVLVGAVVAGGYGYVRQR